MVIAAAGRCEVSSSLNISANNATIGIINFAPYSNFTEADYADLEESTFSKNIDANNLNLSLALTLRLTGVAGSTLSGFRHAANSICKARSYLSATAVQSRQKHN